MTRHRHGLRDRRKRARRHRGGNTPGPYAFRGNRISDNGRYGYWEHNLAGGGQEPVANLVLESNDIRDNALDGIRVGRQSAVVTFNTSTRLALALVRPGAGTAWTDGTPGAGSAYRLPDSSGPAAGVTIAAAVSGAQVSDNRAWDDQRPGTQTHGFSCVCGAVVAGYPFLHPSAALR